MRRLRRRPPMCRRSTKTTVGVARSLPSADGAASRRRGLRLVPFAAWMCWASALENYDAIGRWRTQDGKFPVDASGAFPNGKTFTGPAEMKALLKDDLPEFTRCLAEKMLTYALGRGVESYDRRDRAGSGPSDCGAELQAPGAGLGIVHSAAVPAAAAAI